MPQLLKLFALNRGQGLPQRLFEVDDVVKMEAGHEEPVERLHLVAGVLDSEVGFADIKALSEAVALELGLQLSYQVLEHPGMIPGRSASVHAKGHRIGWMGEVHPMVLEKLRLTHPLVALEMDLSVLLGEEGLH